ncbi:MAG: Ig-like domain-containing protein, partial [Chthoniobacteraceae bacterium]
NANIVLAGSGANRTVTVTLAANGNGSATITLTVNDGVLTASDTFVLTVTSVNDEPTITAIADQNIALNSATAPLPFTIGDIETAGSSLTITKSSSNPSLVPATNIVMNGSGIVRTATVTPASNQVGSATITLGVNDGSITTNTTFVVSVTGTNGQTWRQQYFGSTLAAGNAADDADPDNDSIKNLMERALGLNPLVPSVSGLPGLSLTRIGSQDYVTLTVNKSSAAGDLTFTVEASGNLSLWNSGPAATTLIDNTPTLLRVRDNTAIGVGSPRYMRLRVTSP